MSFRTAFSNQRAKANSYSPERTLYEFAFFEWYSVYRAPFPGGGGLGYSRWGKSFFPGHVRPNERFDIACFVRHTLQLRNDVLLGIFHQPNVDADCVCLVVTLLRGLLVFDCPCPLNFLIFQCFLEVVEHFCHFFVSFCLVLFRSNLPQGIQNETDKGFELTVSLTHTPDLLSLVIFLS